MTSTPITVAVDGTSGSGKSSVARAVAAARGWSYLDTGAMYRSATAAVLDAGVSLDDPAAIATVVDGADIRISTDPASTQVHLGEQDVTERIRGPQVTAAVSAVSAVPAVREVLVARQRDAVAAAGAGIVVEGRDIGTVVLPAATLKVFLTADPAARAARRAAEHGEAHRAQAVQAALERRDTADSERAHSPLRTAEDAVVVDTTDLTLDEVIARVLALVEAAAPA